MTIEKQYHPDPAALDELVEVLYILLVDAPDDQARTTNSEVSALPQSTCFPTEQE